MLFTEWKLRDTVGDSALAPIARMMLFFYRRAFRKTAARLPDEAAECAERIEELRRLERDGVDSSGAFGDMLACMSRFYTDGTDRKAAYSLFYHLGRWICIADAAEDKRRDDKKGRYNAVTAMGIGREEAFAMMGREQEMVLSAFGLLPENSLSPVSLNILSLGLQARGHDIYLRKGRR
jgi:hypothetical protein